MDQITVELNGREFDAALPKEFKSGSRGYYTGGKLTLDGKRYQVSLSIVEVGSKPSAETDTKHGKRTSN